MHIRSHQLLSPHVISYTRSNEPMFIATVGDTYTYGCGPAPDVITLTLVRCVFMASRFYILFLPL